MQTNTNNYIISGGLEGKKRLTILSRVLYAYTKSLLDKEGDIRGKSFLDLGCGGGNVSLMVAQMVGNAGSVTAIDFDEEIIALNKEDAIAEGCSNIDFKAMSAYDINYMDAFDYVYSRFLLSHLTEPLMVLQKMVQSVKPGGKIIVEDIHFSGHCSYPACEAFDKYVTYFTAAAKHNGHNAEIGASLFSLFQLAGIKDIGFDIIQPCFNNGEGKWMAYITMDKIKNALIAQGIADMPAINNILDALEVFTKDETTIISLPCIFRVWGYKK